MPLASGHKLEADRFRKPLRQRRPGLHGCSSSFAARGLPSGMRAPYSKICSVRVVIAAPSVRNMPFFLTDSHQAISTLKKQWLTCLVTRTIALQSPGRRSREPSRKFRAPQFCATRSHLRCGVEKRILGKTIGRQSRIRAPRGSGP